MVRDCARHTGYGMKTDPRRELVYEELFADDSQFGLVICYYNYYTQLSKFSLITVT
jgi:hypothetical protein